MDDPLDLSEDHDICKKFDGKAAVSVASVPALRQKQ